MIGSNTHMKSKDMSDADSTNSTASDVFAELDGTKQSDAKAENVVKNKSGLKEIILATSVNPEGEHTASYIAGLLKPLVGAHGFRVSTLGRGLSTGTELEYSDSETLKSALQNRR
jgi:recombination protein RecR